MSHPAILSAQDTLLLVIDVQDAFLKTIWERERVVENTVTLIEAAKALNVPVLATVQNCARMGGCNKEVADTLESLEAIDKMTFSCLGEESFLRSLKEMNRSQILICGVETHICVNQTAHGLLSLDLGVHIARDAVSSRKESNWQVGIEKMRDSGCVITSTETAIFEMVRDASTPEFKKILPLVK
jgi:nicotinamidase-related amidase